MHLIVTMNIGWLLVAVPSLMCGGYLVGVVLFKQEGKLERARSEQLINEIKNCRSELQSLRNELAALKGPETIVRSLW